MPGAVAQAMHGASYAPRYYVPQPLVVRAIPQLQAAASVTMAKAARSSDPLEGLALAATVAFGETLTLPREHRRAFFLFAKRVLAAGHRSSALRLAAALHLASTYSRCQSTSLTVPLPQTDGFAFRVLAVAMLVATKILEDVSLVRTREWATVCGAVHITPAQLARMEIEFLASIDYNANFSVTDLKVSVKSLKAALFSQQEVLSQESIHACMQVFSQVLADMET
ncbi:hypothetical protein BC830DRAFT_1121101 [Chytriomyces sp. MP71]|nr:hypothetical protein BC830DRAFT_1121101 [Chytriomyces sp. MP71]